VGAPASAVPTAAPRVRFVQQPDLPPRANARRRAPVPADAVPPPTEPRGRLRLLQARQHDLDRRIDPEEALAAIKLRRAAELYAEKDEMARFLPRREHHGSSEARFQQLLAMDVDELIADLEAHPGLCSRSQLTDLAEEHLLRAFDIDRAAYARGVHRAGLYEGLHSVAGRAVTTAAAAATLGISEIVGGSAALHAAQSAARLAGHQLPPNVINPVLTGVLRSATDVKETFKREGGQPQVAATISRSPPMGQLAATIRARTSRLREQIVRLRSGEAEALGPAVDSFVELHDAAHADYKRRIGLNRTQTYSKGYGGAVNAVAATGGVVSVAVPVVGPPVGLALLGACVPLQWGAGYLDERTKHRYAHRANAKWADFLTPEAKSLHYKDLRPEHVSQAALRKAFTPQSELQIEAVRECYTDAIAQLTAREIELERRLERTEGKPQKAAQRTALRLELRQLRAELVFSQRDANDFESFDPKRWERIAADDVIGRCLDDVKELEKITRAARWRKPGEMSSQVLQRYAQAFHGGVASGVTGPLIDGLGIAQAAEASAGVHESAFGGLDIAKATVGGTGAAVFTAATGEVRMAKARNKGLLAQTMTDGSEARQQQFEADRERWSFKAGDRQVDLRQTGAYDRHVHGTWDRTRRLAKALPHSLVGGPVGLVQLASAKLARRNARRTMQELLDELEASDLERDPRAPAPTSHSLAVLKDRLYDFPAVRAQLDPEGSTHRPNRSMSREQFLQEMGTHRRRVLELAIDAGIATPEELIEAGMRQQLGEWDKAIGAGQATSGQVRDASRMRRWLELEAAIDAGFASPGEVREAARLRDALGGPPAQGSTPGLNIRPRTSAPVEALADDAAVDAHASRPAAPKPKGWEVRHWLLPRPKIVDDDGAEIVSRRRLKRRP
jgi:hypothetical protein